MAGQQSEAPTEGQQNWAQKRAETEGGRTERPAAAGAPASSVAAVASSGGSTGRRKVASRWQQEEGERKRRVKQGGLTGLPRSRDAGEMVWVNFLLFV